MDSRILDDANALFAGAQAGRSGKRRGRLTPWPRTTETLSEEGSLMTEEKETVAIRSIDKLLAMTLAVPGYQRPYKWTKKNVAALLDDVEKAIEQRDCLSRSVGGDTGFRYRIGTIILHRNGETFDIVDGQQRIISLLLIRRHLVDDKSFIKMNLFNKVTQANLAGNFAFIKDWFSLRGARKDAVRNAFSDLLEVVVITVEEPSEAFQLFDSQNSRGRALDPHDLLKAYHLREMKGHLFEMRRAVTKWEAVDRFDIKELFGKYLFPIVKWADRDRSIPFTAQEIEAFKGIQETSEYAYAARTRKAMPSFQITEPFIAGDDFFSMVDHYLALLAHLRCSLKEEKSFSELNAILENGGWLRSVGFKYVKTLFECALLCYYDRFRNLDERAVKKLFAWAFMLRVDVSRLGFDSVNCYAIGVGAYTNSLPVFSLIRRARTHTEIANLAISVIRNGEDKAKSEHWQDLYERLKKMYHVQVKTDEQNG